LLELLVRATHLSPIPQLLFATATNSQSHLNATHYATRKYLAFVNKNRIFSIQN
jgi:hypothetical protein